MWNDNYNSEAAFCVCMPQGFVQACLYCLPRKVAQVREHSLWAKINVISTGIVSKVLDVFNMEVPSV